MSRSQELEAKRHDIVHLEAVHCVKPQGAFYANIQETGKLPQEIVNLFLGFGVALLPRSAFGKYGEGCLRLSYANSIPNIQRALMRMDKALNSIN